MRVLRLTFDANRLSALAGLAALLGTGNAVAQAPAEPPVIQPLPEAPTAGPAPLQPAPAQLQPAQLQPAPAQLQPAPAQLPPAPAQPLLPARPAADALAFPEPPPMEARPPIEEPGMSAGDGLHISAFVDAYYGFQTQALGTPVPFHRAYAFNSPDFGAENGFSLSFAGLDASYDGGELGATISLRAGPSVPIFLGGDAGPLGIDNLLQAYATWTPTPSLSIDFGQFGTIFGAEVAESWQNLNYTRGGLYYAMQPFWHTGLRATVSPNDQVAVTGMIVNGVNSITEDNDSPSLALQLSLTPNEAFSLAAGWLTTLKPSSDGGSFDNFVDLVAALTVKRFSLVFNADLAVNSDVTNEGEGYRQTVQDPLFWGLSLAMGYQATDLFGLALRGEYLSDGDNQLYQVTQRGVGTVTFPATTQTNVFTLTGTLDFKPVHGSDALIIRWDNRIETSNRDVFFNRSSEESDVWFGSVLGVVVTTDG